MSSDAVFFPLGENKGFTYCFQAVLLLTLSDDGEDVSIAWALGSKFPPCSNSSRSMALDKSLLRSQLSVQQRQTHRLNVMSESTMIRHLQRHEGKLWSSPMVEIKLTDVETPSHHKDEALSK